jgi:hypothetical protein
MPTLPRPALQLEKLVVEAVRARTQLGPHAKIEIQGFAVIGSK